MIEAGPIDAIFSLVGAATLGLTGIAAGPVITPMFILLYLGFKASGG